MQRFGSNGNVVLKKDIDCIMDGTCEKMETKRTPIYRRKWRELKFLDHVMKKRGLKNLTTRGYIGGNMYREKHRETYQESLCIWMVEDGLE